MPQLSAEDVLFTAGALILGLWAYRTINTFVSYGRAYASTRLYTEETPPGYVTVDRCTEVESEECCQQAQDAQGLVSDEGMKNCHLCNHPSCVDVTAERDDPAIALPFKKGIVGIIKPKGSDIYNYVYDPTQNLESLKKAQYAYAY